jgi:shikimate kinase
LKKKNLEINNNSNLFITGFMGVGKTTIGELVAQKLNRKFFDLDKEIEEYLNLPVLDIIEKFGVEYFRKIENQKLALLCTYKEVVVALGGGTLIHNKNLKQVEKSGYLVYLMGDYTTVKNRLMASYQRPLFKNMDKSAFEILFEERKEGYTKAQLCVQTDGLLPDQVSNRILHEYKSINDVTRITQ